jgi:hypothetical protein
VCDSALESATDAQPHLQSRTHLEGVFLSLMAPLHPTIAVIAARMHHQQGIENAVPSVLTGVVVRNDNFDSEVLLDEAYSDLLGPIYPW